MRNYLITVCLVALPLTANSALIDRGNGLIYDSDLDITWLQDANYAMTSGYDADGKMTWQEATNWVTQLTYGGFDNWRLPTTTLPDDGCAIADGTKTGSYGFNCTGSEMATSPHFE